jgi:hypothetical protein
MPFCLIYGPGKLHLDEVDGDWNVVESLKKIFCFVKKYFVSLCFRPISYRKI